LGRNVLAGCRLAVLALARDGGTDLEEVLDGLPAGTGSLHASRTGNRSCPRGRRMADQIRAARSGKPRGARTGSLRPETKQGQEGAGGPRLLAGQDFARSPSVAGNDRRGTSSIPAAESADFDALRRADVGLVRARPRGQKGMRRRRSRGLRANAASTSASRRMSAPGHDSDGVAAQADLQAAPRQPVHGFQRLIAIGHAREDQRPALPGSARELAAKQLRSVRLDDDLAVEVGSCAPPQIVVRGSCITVGTRMEASPIRVDAVLEADVGAVVGRDDRARPLLVTSAWLRVRPATRRGLNPRGWGTGDALGNARRPGRRFSGAAPRPLRIA
jgi:hypothetical protein